VVVYDLRHDPKQFDGQSKDDLAKNLFATKEERGDAPRIPVKELSFNKCPAVAPLGVLDADAQKRLDLSLDTITANVQHLKQAKDFLYAIRDVFASRPPYPAAQDVESKLYDSFMNKKDLPRIAAVRSADASALADFHPEFIDERLPELLLRYKARQFPASLSEAEQQTWEEYRSDRITKALPAYLQTLSKLASEGKDTFLLEELQLWAESVAPASD
jgi:exodeoxyribonuclease-1